MHRDCALSRREFLSWAVAASAASSLSPRLKAQVTPPRSRRFEVAAPLYAWHLHDEGVERILDNLQGLAAVNSVYLIGLMHPERRPFREGTYPHNPVRKTWQVEDARCYWHPDTKLYGRIKPRLSGYDWLNQTDWLRELVAAARKRGLKTGVEFSHSLLDGERMGREFADLAQRNLHGRVSPEGLIKWLHPPCPNHPATVEYAVALAADAAANYDVDFVQSCIMNFDSASPELGGGCFCDHCKAAAKATGLDLGWVQNVLLSDAKNERALGEWVAFRNASNARFYQKLHETLCRLKPAVDLRFNAASRSYALYGVSLSLLLPHVDSMRLTYYAEQEGDPSLMNGKRKWLAGVRKQLGGTVPLIAALGVRLEATPELIREGVTVAVETGMNGITAGHYDGATFEMLHAVREGLVAAGIPLQRRKGWTASPDDR